MLTGPQDVSAVEEMKTGADSQSSCMEIEGNAHALKPKSKINRQKR